MEDNRLQSIKLPKAPTKLIEPLTPHEIQKIIDSIDIHSYTGIRNYALLITLLDTGIRESEITGITLNNLNLQDG
ncbi:tyrosine-type recombinase/integrase, partial [Chloroflexota bacterium]